MGAREAGNHRPAAPKVPAAPPGTRLGVFGFLITSRDGLCLGNRTVQRERDEELYIRARDERARPLSCKRALQASQVFVVSCAFMAGIFSLGQEDEANDFLMFTFDLSAQIFKILFFCVLSIA